MLPALTLARELWGCSSTRYEQCLWPPFATSVPAQFGDFHGDDGDGRSNCKNRVKILLAAYYRWGDEDSERGHSLPSDTWLGTSKDRIYFWFHVTPSLSLSSKPYYTTPQVDAQGQEPHGTSRSVKFCRTELFIVAEDTHHCANYINCCPLWG